MMSLLSHHTHTHLSHTHINTRTTHTTHHEMVEPNFITSRWVFLDSRNFVDNMETVVWALAVVNALFLEFCVHLLPTAGSKYVRPALHHEGIRQKPFTNCIVANMQHLMDGWRIE